MKFTVYILYDDQKDRFYIGQTQNLADRLTRHVNMRSKYTKSGNWQLVYSEGYSTRSEAVRRERHLKSLKSKTAIKKIVNLGL